MLQRTLVQRALRVTPSRIASHTQSFRMARRFAACGPGFLIGYPATVGNPAAITVGKGVYVREHAWLNCDFAEPGRRTLFIGDETYIGRFAHINAVSSVILEQKVLIADRVHISDSDHAFDDPDRPVMDQGLSPAKPVLLRSGCWLGAGVVVLPGVTIGRNAVVGANAVVTHDVPDGAVVGGVPARVIRLRNGDDSADRRASASMSARHMPYGLDDGH